jgi:DNA-binding transcriptional ArsR family regulator
MNPVQVVVEPRRSEILRLIWDDERSAGDIASRFGITFGAVSQHLGVLRDAGFVRVRKEGTRRFYRADRQHIGPLKKVLEAMWTTELDRLALAIEEDHRR